MVTQSSEGAHIQGQTPPVMDWSGTLRGGASPHWCFWGGISFLCCLPAWDSGSFGASLEGWSWGCGILEVGFCVLQHQQVLSSLGPCTLWAPVPEQERGLFWKSTPGSWGTAGLGVGLLLERRSHEKRPVCRPGLSHVPSGPVRRPWAEGIG